MLNIGGGEVVVIALVALIALGPEQLPVVMRRLGALTAQIRSMSSDLKDEFLSGIDQPGSSNGHGPNHNGRHDPGRPIVPRGYAEQQAAGTAEATGEPEDTDGPGPSDDGPAQPAGDRAPTTDDAPVGDGDQTP